MRYTLTAENKERKEEELKTYLFDVVAGLADDRAIDVNEERLRIMTNPFSEPPKTIDLSEAYQALDEGKTLFIQYKGKAEVTPFVKRGNEILTGADLVNKLNEEPEANPVDAIPKPGFIANLLNKIFGIKTRSMVEYESRRAEALEESAVRTNAKQLSNRMDEEKAGRQVRIKSSARRQREEELAAEEARFANFNEADLEENLRIGDMEPKAETDIRREAFLQKRRLIAEVIAGGLLGRKASEEAIRSVEQGTVLKEMLRDTEAIEAYADAAENNKLTLVTDYEAKLKELNTKQKQTEKAVKERERTRQRAEEKEKNSGIRQLGQKRDSIPELKAQEPGIHN